MKILIATQFYIEGSGSGIYVQNIAREFQDAGHEVRVLSCDKGPVGGKPYPVRTIVFDREGKGQGDLNFDIPYFTTHPASNQTFYDLDDAQFNEYVKVLGDTLKDEMDQFKPDVVHCQHASIFSYHLAKLGVPYVITLHGTGLMGFKKEPRFYDMVMEGARGAYKIISISRQVTDEAVELLKIPQEKIVLIHNGYDENLFYPRKVTRAEVLKKNGVEGEAKSLVSFVGKLAHFKGIDTLIRAAGIYEKKIPGVKTVIVGQGQLRDELEGLSKELGLKGLSFLGHKTQEEVAEIYSVADVSTVPSRHEPFGLVAIEALACGTPVVVTNGGGLVDFVDDKVGSVVEIDDPEGLAAAIVKEIESGSKETKGTYAAKYASEGFSWKIPVKRMVDLFKEAAGT